MLETVGYSRYNRNLISCSRLICCYSKGGETKLKLFRSHTCVMHQKLYNLTHLSDWNKRENTFFRTIAEYSTNNSACQQRARGFLCVFILQYTCFNCSSNHRLWCGDNKCRYNAYHPHMGIFIAAKYGLYVFTWIIRSYGQTYHTTELLKFVNNNIIKALYFNPNAHI